MRPDADKHCSGTTAVCRKARLLNRTSFSITIDERETPLRCNEGEGYRLCIQLKTFSQRKMAFSYRLEGKYKKNHGCYGLPLYTQGK